MGCMSAHEVHFWLVTLIGLHIGNFSLVFEHATIWRMVLVSIGNALEIEFVCVALSVHLGHDVFVVVVAKGTTELVVVHVRLAFPLPPALGHLIWVGHLEFTVGSLPGNDASVIAVRQKLQQELPQLDLTRAFVTKKETFSSR